MEIKIHGWESKGISGVDMKIDLNKPGSKTPTKIGMIWLDSGGGKTTSHELIKACLTGKIETLEEEYKKSNGKSSKYERRDDDDSYSETGQFRLDVSFDKEFYQFEIKFDHRGKTVDIDTNSPSGYKEGYHPPLSALPYLGSKFVDLFILDGEHAKKAIQTDSGMADITLNTIYQLDRFDDINESLEIYFKKEKDKSKGNVSDKGKITQIENKIEALKDRQAELSKQLRLNNEKKVKTFAEKKRLEKEEKQINTEEQAKRDKLAEEEKKQIKLKNDIDLIKIKIFELLRKPHHLSSDIAKSFISFTKNLRKLDLPGDSAKEFFQNLVKTDKCVCDEPMTDARKEIIIKNSNDYIGTDHSNFASSMKQDVNNFIVNQEEGAQDNLANFHTELDSKIEQLTTLDREIEILRKNVKAASGRNLDDIKNDIDACNDILADIKLFIKDYEAFDNNVNENLRPKDIKSTNIIKALLKQFKSKLNLGNDLHNKDLKIQEMKVLIEKIKNEAKEQYKKELIVAMNSELDEIIDDDKITITAIDTDIQFDGGSTGQGLVIAYVFLIKAFEQANKANKFPLLVDSPAAPIGPRYRASVAQMITKLSNQYICLLQGGERAWWCKELYNNSTPDITALTIFKRTKYYQKYFDNPDSGLKKFPNAGMVPGYKFLALFDSEFELNDIIEQLKNALPNLSSEMIQQLTDETVKQRELEAKEVKNV